MLPTVYTKSAKAEKFNFEFLSSYDEVQGARNDLARFTYFQSKNLFQSQMTSAKTNLPSVGGIVLIPVTDHLCPENSVILTLLWHNGRVQTALMHVGFLTYLPYPVTEYSTGLYNFLKIQTQLNQSSYQ